MTDTRDGMPAPPVGWSRLDWAQELHARTAAAARRHPGTIAGRTRPDDGGAGWPELPADRTDRRERKAA